MEPKPPAAPPDNRQPFLGVQFVACRVYGRLYLNNDGSAYAGRCPRCGAPVRVPVGEQGTSQRFFQAMCP